VGLGAQLYIKPKTSRGEQAETLKNCHSSQGTSQVATVRAASQFKMMDSCHVLAIMFILLAVFLKGFKQLYFIQ